MWVKAAVVVDREGDKLTVWTSDPITEGSEQPRTFGRGYITELTADEFVKLGARPKEEVVEGRGTSEEGREAEASENEEERSVGSTDGTQIFTQEEAISFIAQMEGRAKVAPELELTIENWDAQFGEDGRVITPIGVVKMGENQFTKLMRQGRNGKLGMIKPTLEEPDIIIEDSSKAKDGDIAERNSSYVFVKAFKKADGSRYYYFTSITVSKDGLEVVVSNQEKSHNRILRLMTEGKVLWRTPKNATTASVEQQGLDYVQPTKTETATKDSGVTPQSTDMSPSIDKGSGKLESSQREGVKEAETQVESENQHYDGEVTVAGTTDKDGITTFLFSLYRRSRKDGKVKRVSLGGIEAKSENFILDPEDDGFDEFLATTTSKIRVKKIRTNGERYFADIAVLGEGHYDGVEMKPEAAQRLIQKAEDGADAMPMREVEYGDGEVGKEPDFSQVTPERTARYLDNESGMDSTDVDKFVDNMIAKATKAAEEHAQQRPEMGEDEMPGRFSQRLNEWKAQGEDLQKQKTYWDAVKAERERKAQEPTEVETVPMEGSTAEADTAKMAIDEQREPEATEVEAQTEPGKPMTESQRKAAENIASKLGYTIEWHDTMPENGRIDYATRTIHLAKDAENPLVMVFGHETYHEIARDSETRDNVQNFAKSILGEKEFERRVKAKQERYSNLYGENRTLMEDEVVADFFGKILKDNDLLERVCWEADHKILSAINRVLDKILSSIGFKDANLIKAKQIVADAYESAINRYKESKRLEFERTDPDETGVKAIEAATDEPIELYNMRTEDELRDKILKWAKRKEAKNLGWVKDNIEDIIKETGDLFNLIHSAIGDDPNYAEFAKKKPTMKIDWRDNKMKPTVTWARANIEYKYDVSGDLLCIKNKVWSKHCPVQLWQN